MMWYWDALIIFVDHLPCCNSTNVNGFQHLSARIFDHVQSCSTCFLWHCFLKSINHNSSVFVNIFKIVLMIESVMWRLIKGLERRQSLKSIRKITFKAIFDLSKESICIILESMVNIKWFLKNPKKLLKLKGGKN